jgi:AcrR family transcriptional regulator
MLAAVPVKRSSVVDPGHTVPVTPERLDEVELRAADGRVPGRRGRATRTRLLECTVEMLGTTSFRELKVIDIAREASTSPATFYQYFSDVESAILVLAEEMALETAELAHYVRTAPWPGAAGYQTALTLSDQFIEFWDRHRSLLRVVDLATGEGDPRFTAIRTGMLREVTVALSEAIEAAGPRVHPDLDPMATAGVLVAMLANVASHRPGFENRGIHTSDARRSMAHLVFWSVTGQRPPG